MSTNRKPAYGVTERKSASVYKCQDYSPPIEIQVHKQYKTDVFNRPAEGAEVRP
jgi:hypothetical protein